ncbi:GtrA family protein [Grimontia kaedaensis]|uniref:GtrA family protein n=1 Tax=Grimontia kaedaensis TaxID=2872157 RepID=A0ABY4WZQ3_9GAMM|nr:GtrA family protein [Grimontia kaedaensis]
MFRYGIVGIFSTLIHYFTSIFLVSSTSFGFVTSGVIGFLVAYTFSFSFQSLFVFKEKLQLSSAFKFFLVQVVALTCSLGVSEIASGMSDYVRMFVVVMLLPLMAYFIHSIWTFRT